MEYTINQASKMLGVKVRTIREWIRLGKIEATKGGKCWMIPDEEVARIIGQGGRA